MTPFTYPVAPQPVPGETFGSWVRRLAAANLTPLMHVLHHLGLIDRAHHTAKPTAYGLHLTDDQLATIEHMTGIDSDRIKATLFSTWIGGPAKPVSLDEANLSESARRFGQNNWLYVNHSHYCPQCLEETGGAWQLAWRLPWVFACLAHGRFLREMCPGCQRRPEAGLQDGQLAPPFPAAVPKPGHCHNVRLKGRENGRMTGACHHALYQDDPGKPAPEALLAVQRHAIEALQTADAQWWSDLRTLTIYALTGAAQPDTLDRLSPGPLPEAVRQAWVDHVRSKAEALEARRSEVASQGIDHRKGRKNSTAKTPPTNPLLMAGATTVALVALESDESLGALIKVGRLDPTRATPTGRLRQLGASQNLVQRAITVSADEGTQAAAISLAGRYTGQAKLQVAWNPDHLPPLLWDDLHDECMAAVLGHAGLSRRIARRFAVVALYRAATGCNWTEAASHFSNATSDNDRMPYTVTSRLRANGPDGVFGQLAEAVSRLADALAKDPRMASYPALRAAATRLLSKPIPHATYKAMLPSDEMRCATKKQQRWAAVWAWAQLVGDDERIAPAWGEPPTDSQMEAYWRWRASSAEVRAALEHWAAIRLISASPC